MKFHARKYVMLVDTTMMTSQLIRRRVKYENKVSGDFRGEATVLRGDSSPHARAYGDWLSHRRKSVMNLYLFERFCRNKRPLRSEEHTSELQSRENLVCRLL